MGRENQFQVPVRGYGYGTIVIGSRNVFRVRHASTLGNGEILLQARGLEAQISIGNRNSFNNNVSIIAAQKITLGDDCLIGDQVLIYDSDFHDINPSLRKISSGPSHPVCIGNNVWLGSRVMVLKGVTIGDNSVVGAMSLVDKSIPANCVAAGNPVEVVRYIQ